MGRNITQWKSFDPSTETPDDFCIVTQSNRTVAELEDDSVVNISLRKQYYYSSGEAYASDEALYKGHIYFNDLLLHGSYTYEYKADELQDASGNGLGINIANMTWFTLMADAGAANIDLSQWDANATAVRIDKYTYIVNTELALYEDEYDIGFVETEDGVRYRNDDVHIFLTGNEADNVLTAPQGKVAGGAFYTSGGNDTFILNPNSGTIGQIYHVNETKDNPGPPLYNRIHFESPLDGSVVTIQNFNPEFDKIYLNEEIFTDIVDGKIREGIAAEDIDLTYPSNPTFSPKLLGSYLLYNQDNGELAYDCMGTGSYDNAVLFAKFTGNPLLDDSVFHVETFTI